MCLFSTAVSSVVTGSLITLQWTAPQSLDEESIASYVITLSPVQDTADAVTYTLPASRQNATLGGLHPGVTYQVQLKTETSSGLQPFYSANMTTATLQPPAVGAIGGASELAWSGGGAGVMLAIVLVAFVCCVPVVVCCIVWRRRKSSKKDKTDERYTQCWHNTCAMCSVISMNKQSISIAFVFHNISIFSYVAIAKLSKSALHTTKIL